MIAEDSFLLFVTRFNDALMTHIDSRRSSKKKITIIIIKTLLLNINFIYHVFNYEKFFKKQTQRMKNCCIIKVMIFIIIIIVIIIIFGLSRRSSKKITKKSTPQSKVKKLNGLNGKHKYQNLKKKKTNFNI